MASQSEKGSTKAHAYYGVQTHARTDRKHSAFSGLQDGWWMHRNTKKQALTTITQQFLKGRSYQSDHQSDHRRRQKVQI